MMEQEDNNPIRGTIIGAKFQRQRMTDDQKPLNTVQRTIYTIWALFVMPGFGLLVGAIIQRQTTYLIGAIVSILVWMFSWGVIFGVEKLMPMIAAKRKRPRDEETVARLDWLTLASHANELGPTVNIKGTLGWITEDWILLSTGRYYPWNEFLGASFELKAKNVIKVTFLRRQPLAWLWFAIPFLLVLIVPMTWATWVDLDRNLAGLRHVGFRNDVLADICTTPLNLPILINLYQKFVEVCREPKSTPRKLFAYVDSRVMSRSDLERFLSKYISNMSK